MYAPRPSGSVKTISILGDHSSGVPPVPIPNTEVKPASADGTAGVIRWESRSLPNLNKSSPRAGIFFWMVY